MSSLARKLRKLQRNPTRFFRDFWAKRTGLRAPQSGVIDAGEAASLMAGRGWDTDSRKDPFLALSRQFDLRSGALTGTRDQSLLVDAEDMGDVIDFLVWSAIRRNEGLRFYALHGQIETILPAAELRDQSNRVALASRFGGKPSIVVEPLAAVARPALQLFQYREDEGGDFRVRSPKAYLKRGSRTAFERSFPEPAALYGRPVVETPFPIDLVYTWVDASDPAWLAAYDRATGGAGIDTDRFVSKGELQFSLRSAAAYAPFVNKIYVVSNCAMPSWLEGGEDFHWVDHEEIFDDPSVLPTFNSHAIEACLHRIRGLSEHFIYMNDDFVFTRPAYWTDYFDSMGRAKAVLEPYGMVAEDPHVDPSRDFLVASQNAARHLRTLYPDYRATQLHEHAPYALRRSTIAALEERMPEAFARTRSATRRCAQDINVASFLAHHYGLASGASVTGEGLSQTIRQDTIGAYATPGALRSLSSACFNDGDGSADDAEYRASFVSLMESLFPAPSSFEASSETDG